MAAAPACAFLIQKPGAGLLPSEVAWLLPELFQADMLSPEYHHRAVRSRLNVCFGKGLGKPLWVRSPGTLAVSSSLTTYESHCRSICCFVRFVGR
jgi:hypothetical protein